MSKGGKINALADFIEQYKTGILGTLFFHIFGFSVMVFIDISRTVSSQERVEFLEIQSMAEEDLKMLEMLESKAAANQGQDVKNLAVNEGEETKKTFGDYEKEFDRMVGNQVNQKLYQAQDYADKRWLIKDYGSEDKTLTNPDSKEVIREDKQDVTYKPNQGKVYFGPSTLSYKLQGRTPLRLPVPSYKCIGNGKVVMDITVNRRGEVVSAVVVSSNASEECLLESAKQAALGSEFNPDYSAPASQKGSVTYSFIAQ